jgi:NADPH:quinone reductase-like Zn-dependent oxidoreductase
MSNSIPESMQAVRLEEENGKLQVRELPVPEPGPGEVLVRMAASTIDPADIVFMNNGGAYVGRNLPVVPGIEGSGSVIASGPGFLPKFLKGKRVACSRPPEGDGTWAEYMLTKASLCAPLRKNVSLEKGANLIVNPMTAVIFLEIIKEGKHAAVVNSAAASQLGRMLLRLTQKKNIPLINIVRREEQADLLRSLGAEHVLVSTDPNFDQELTELTHHLNATLILDAISGEFTQRLVNTSPSGSLILNYANLSRSPISIEPNSLWSYNRRVEGFYLANWASKQNMIRILRISQLAQKLLNSDLSTEFQKRIPITSVQDGLERYQKNMTAGKVLLVIDQDEISLNG